MVEGVEYEELQLEENDEENNKGTLSKNFKLILIFLASIAIISVIAVILFVFVLPEDELCDMNDPNPENCTPEQFQDYCVISSIAKGNCENYCTDVEADNLCPYQETCYYIGACDVDNVENNDCPHFNSCTECNPYNLKNCNTQYIDKECSENTYIYARCENWCNTNPANIACMSTYCKNEIFEEIYCHPCSLDINSCRNEDFDTYCNDNNEAYVECVSVCDYEYQNNDTNVCNRNFCKENNYDIALFCDLSCSTMAVYGEYELLCSASNNCKTETPNEYQQFCNPCSKEYYKEQGGLSNNTCVSDETLQNEYCSTFKSECDAFCTDYKQLCIGCTNESICNLPYCVNNYDTSICNGNLINKKILLLNGDGDKSHLGNGNTKYALSNYFDLCSLEWQSVTPQDNDCRKNSIPLNYPWTVHKFENESINVIYGGVCALSGTYMSNSGDCSGAIYLKPNDRYMSRNPSAIRLTPIGSQPGCLYAITDKDRTVYLDPKIARQQNNAWTPITNWSSFIAGNYNNFFSLIFA